MSFRVLFLMLVLALPSSAAECFTASTNLAKLIAPTKLAKLDQRGVNSRIYMAVAILEDAGRGPGKCAWWFVASNAVLYAGYTNFHLAKMTREALTSNWGNASGRGVLTAEGLAELRRGQAATVKSGLFAGDELKVDHIISPSVAPELANVIANMELVENRLI